jgi:hypothetical protein
VQGILPHSGTNPPTSQHSLQCKIYKIIFKTFFAALESQHYHPAERCETDKQMKGPEEEMSK